MSQTIKGVPQLKPRFGAKSGFQSRGNVKSVSMDGKKGESMVKFDPARFKTQHKG